MQIFPNFLIENIILFTSKRIFCCSLDLYCLYLISGWQSFYFYYFYDDIWEILNHYEKKICVILAHLRPLTNLMWNKTDLDCTEVVS